MATATTATKERKGQQEEKEEEEEGGRGLSKIEFISSNNELITSSFFLIMQPSANRYEV